MKELIVTASAARCPVVLGIAASGVDDPDMPTSKMRLAASSFERSEPHLEADRRPIAHERETEIPLLCMRFGALSLDALSPYDRAYHETISPERADPATILMEKEEVFEHEDRHYRATLWERWEQANTPLMRVQEVW